jgi:PAS domain S-box-containing protein
MKNFKQTESLARRLISTILLISIFFLVEFAGLYLSSQTVLKGLSQLYQANQVNENLENVKKIVSSIEDILHAPHAKIENANFLVFFNSATAQAQTLLQESLRNSNIDSPSIHELIGQAAKSLNDLTQTLAHPPQKEVAASAQNFISLQFALETREHVNKAQIELNAYVSQLFSPIYAHRFQPLIVSLVLDLGLILIVLYLGFRIFKHIDLSLQNLLKATSAVAVGDLNVKIPILAPDELGSLTDKFNKMTENLRNSTVSRDYLESILESLLDSVLVIDASGRIQRVNRVMCKTFSCDIQEVLGKPLQNFLPDYSLPKQGRDTTEAIALTQRGKHFPVLVTVSPLDFQGQTQERKVCVIRDITAMKEVEQQLKKRNTDLANANRELEAFSYSVSHDLRSPLRSVDGFSQALAEDFGSLLPEEAHGYLDRIRAAVQRMGKLIDDLLNLSRITRGQIHPATVDLSQIAHELENELKMEEPGRHVEFQIQEHIQAFADPNLIRVVLQNLLSNAWKYTSKHAEAHINFGAIVQGGRNIYFVHDDGAGFDMAYSKKLFGAFQRLHANSEFPGTGVGLATVQRIIHRHGGAIWAESEVEKGTTFYFTL